MTDSLSRQPDYHFQWVDIAEVDFPDSFLRFLHVTPDDTITLSNLQKFGQFSPLLVEQQSESQYRLLAGYPYFIALKTLGMQKVVCQILPSSTPLITLFSLQILHGLSSPQSSPILQAHLLRQAQLALSEEELLSLLALMGYKPQRYKLRELTMLLQLEPSAILALHRGSLSQKSGRYLALLSPEDQHHVVTLIRTYRLGGSKQQKLIEMVTELVLRDHRTVGELLEKWLIGDQETSPENLPQQLHSLMQYLHAQCYPDKVAAEKKFSKLVQELQPSQEITIEHSLSFEDERLEIRLRFSDTETLRTKWGLIKAITQK